MNATTRILGAALLAVLLAPGCRSLGTGGGTGAVIGSAVGAGGGYAIGRHNGNKWAGTAIGALAGGVAGWFIGDAVEPATHERPLTRPAVYRVDGTRAPALPRVATRTMATAPLRAAAAPPLRAPRVTERVIIRDIYPDGTVRERTVPLD